jgi:hypothetical protein
MSSKDEGSSAFDNLIAGTQKNLVTEPATIGLSQAFSRGQILGRVTATGKWKVLDEDSVASFNRFGIATQAIDTTLGETVTDVFVEGEFSDNGVIFAYSDIVADWSELLEAQGIYLRATISTAGV